MVLVEDVVEEKVVVAASVVREVVSEAHVAVASVAQEDFKIKIPLIQRDFLFLLARHP